MSAHTVRPQDVFGLRQAGRPVNLVDVRTPREFEAFHADGARSLPLDRLDAHDIGADIYLPYEFDGRLTVGDYRIASAQALVDVMEEMKDELSVEEDEAEYEDEDEEDEEEEMMDESTVIEAQLRNIWKLVNDACAEAIDKNVALHLRV